VLALVHARDGNTRRIARGAAQAVVRLEAAIIGIGATPARPRSGVGAIRICRLSFRWNRRTLTERAIRQGIGMLAKETGRC
jgi:hypothetical protein